MSSPSWDAVPSGTRLPVVPRFKGTLTARYTLPIAADLYAHIQGSFSYQSRSNPALAPVATPSRYAQCTQFGELTSLSPGVPICALKPLTNINTPRSLGVRLSQRF